MNKFSVSVLVAAALTGLVAWLISGRGPAIESLPIAAEATVQVTLRADPPRPQAGQATRLTMSLTDRTGTPVTDLMRHHARLLHVLVIGEDLDLIGHIHPADFPDLATEQAGEHSIEFTFPRAGRYLLALDAMNSTESISRQFVVKVGGGGAMLSPQRNTALQRCVRGHAEDGVDRYVQAISLAAAATDCDSAYVIELIPPSGSLRAGEALKFGFRVARGDTPLTDLNPYLDAAIHLAIVPRSLDALLHEHGLAGDGAAPPEVDHSTMDHSMHDMGTSMGAEMDHSLHDMGAMAGMSHHAPPPPLFGPALHTEGIVIPRSGEWQMFAQIKHDGQLIVAAFTLDIEEGFADAEATIVQMDLKDGVLAPSVQKFTEGEKIVLRIVSDVDADFHVHGYDLERRLRKGQTTELRFTARLTGRFGIEYHPRDPAGNADGRDLGAIEVYPR